MSDYKVYKLKIQATGEIEVLAKCLEDAKDDVDLYDIEIVNWEGFEVLEAEELERKQSKHFKPIDWKKVPPILKLYAEAMVEQLSKPSLLVKRLDKKT